MSDFEDAERWRALISCARVRVVDSTGLTSDVNSYGRPYGDYAHISINLWTEHACKSDEWDVEHLTKFADKAVAVKNKSLND